MQILGETGSCQAVVVVVWLRGAFTGISDSDGSHLTQGTRALPSS